MYSADALNHTACCFKLERVCLAQWLLASYGFEVPLNAIIWERRIFQLFCSWVCFAFSALVSAFQRFTSCYVKSSHVWAATWQQTTHFKWQSLNKQHRLEERRSKAQPLINDHQISIVQGRHKTLVQNKNKTRQKFCSV